MPFTPEQLAHIERLLEENRKQQAEHFDKLIELKNSEMQVLTQENISLRTSIWWIDQERSAEIEKAKALAEKVSSLELDNASLQKQVDTLQAAPKLNRENAVKLLTPKILEFTKRHKTIVAELKQKCANLEHELQELKQDQDLSGLLDFSDEDLFGLSQAAAEPLTLLTKRPRLD